jgi:hypothetical protein
VIGKALGQTWSALRSTSHPQCQQILWQSPWVYLLSGGSTSMVGTIVSAGSWFAALLSAQWKSPWVCRYVVDQPRWWTPLCLASPWLASTFWNTWPVVILPAVQCLALCTLFFHRHSGCYARGRRKLKHNQPKLSHIAVSLLKLNYTESSIILCLITNCI